MSAAVQRFPADTTTPWGRAEYDYEVLAYIYNRESATSIEIKELTSTSIEEVMSSLSRLQALNAVRKWSSALPRYTAVDGERMDDVIELWDRPGGHLLRRAYRTWRASLPPPVAAKLDQFLRVRLSTVIRILDDWIISTHIDTETAEGEARMDDRVLRALRIVPGSTVKELRPYSGGRYMQIRQSLDRLVRKQHRVAWKNGGYWLPPPGGETGYLVRGREELDHLTAAAVARWPDGATIAELWIEVPGTREGLRASLQRLLHRGSIGNKMWSGIIRFAPKGADDVR